MSLQKAKEVIKKETDEKIIGEVMQYDWLVTADSDNELGKILNLITRFASKYQLDENGRITRDNSGKAKLNVYSIPASWEVPFVSVCSTTKRKISLPGFKLAKEVIFPEVIGSNPIAISTICTEDNLKQLDKNKISRVTEKYIFGQAYEFICGIKEK